MVKLIATVQPADNPITTNTHLKATFGCNDADSSALFASGWGFPINFSDHQEDLFMDETKFGRREVLTAGSAAAVGLSAVASATPAEAADPATAITDSLSDEHANLLTEAAASITEGDAVLLNKSLRNPDTPLPENLVELSIEDIQSLHAAFQQSHENTYDMSSLSPSLVGTAHADSACCCCTPASCCCAAAQSVPSRSRRIA